jgi:nucleoside-diphosphate-sugar epimerase
VRLLVTGASGFVGRRLLPRLAAEGHEPVALLLPGEARPDGGLAAAAAIVRGDVTRPETLAGAADGCDGVVHLAAAVGYGQRMEHCLRLNRDGTAHVAAEAARAGARRFVQMSSVSVYGRAPDRPLDEDAPLRRTGDPYGDTKIDAERLLEACARRGALDLTLLRPTVLHGPGDLRFLPKLVENLRSGRARVVGSGRNTVDAIHVDDVAEAVVRVLREPRAVGRAYNLNHPANPTWNELVAAVAEALGVAAPARHVPYPAALALAGALEAAAKLRGREPRLTRYAVRVVGRQYRYLVDRARAELGFVAGRGLLESVREQLGAAPPPADAAR